MSRILSSSRRERLLILLIPIPLSLLVGFFILIYVNDAIFKAIRVSYNNKFSFLMENIQLRNEKILEEEDPCSSINRQTVFDDARRDFILTNDKNEVLCTTISNFDSKILLSMLDKDKNKDTIKYKNAIGFVNSKNGLTIISVINEYYLRVVFGFYTDERVVAVTIFPGKIYFYNKVKSVNKTKKSVFISSDEYNFGVNVYLGGQYLNDIYIRCFILVIVLSLSFSLLYLIIKPLINTSLIKELNKAIDDGELYLVYHSWCRSRNNYSGQNNYLVGYESLVRWKHPKLGVIRPDYFIPIAEKFGLINKLTHYVLEQAYKEWASVERNRSISLLVSINIPPDFLLNENNVNLIKDYMGKFSELNIELVLELTENQEVCSEKIKIVNALFDSGVMIAIDDFGTGQTSLSMLQSTKINFLKIDKIFVDAIESEYMNTYVLDSIIKLSHDLGVVVIAEGVETQKQCEYLLSKGVEVQQGYYFSVPREISTIYNIK